MRRSSLILLTLLLSTNAAWYFSGWTLHPPTHYDTATARGDFDLGMEGGEPAERVSKGGAGDPGKEEGREATLRSQAATAPSMRSAQARAPSPPQQAATQNAQEAAANRAREMVRGLRSKILQIRDVGKRSRGLASMVDAVRSEDATLARTALKSLFELRSANFDYESLRSAVRSRLTDEDEQIRRAASSALRHVQPTPRDVEYLLDLFAARPAETHLLATALHISKRAEGRSADAWLAAFEAAEPERELEMAMMLSHIWVAEEVEDVVIDAFQRTAAKERDRGWYAVVGSMRPTRAARVRLIFDEERRGEWRGAASAMRHQYEAAVRRGALDPLAAPVAASLALELLHTPPDSRTVNFCLDVLEKHGTWADARDLKVYASSPLVAQNVRQWASRVADTIERRQ